MTAAVQALGVPTDHLSLYDGSGLSVQTRVAPAVLGRVLVLAGAADHPQLRPILTGLAVAGFSGSLEPPRFDAPGTSGAAGLVRAKTGTLTGVSAMAGTVEDAAGRQLVFVFVADQRAGRWHARCARRARPAGRRGRRLRLLGLTQPAGARRVRWPRVQPGSGPRRLGPRGRDRGTTAASGPAGHAATRPARWSGSCAATPLEARGHVRAYTGLDVPGADAAGGRRRPAGLGALQRRRGCDTCSSR